AEKLEEQGNVSFKAKCYGETVGLYTNAIELEPTESAYLTNCAAMHMALKKFSPTLDDCQQAATLQSAAPATMTLVRLERCQLALGAPTPAVSTRRGAAALAKGARSAHVQSRRYA
ncbi:hypothetical protein FA95DRAFT_1507109, partial [Auriscalpium vulgare]